MFKLLAIEFGNDLTVFWHFHIKDYSLHGCCSRIRILAAVHIQFGFLVANGYNTVDMCVEFSFFMLRDDYEKLCRIWDEKADTEHYSCVRSNDQFNIRHSATEIKDNNTTFINRHSVDLDIHQGLMIDVIPLDAVPKSKWKQLWQMVDSMMYCCFNFQRLPAHKGKITYYAEKLALTLVPSFKARYKMWKGAEKRLSRYSLADAEYVSSFGEGATIMRQRFPIRWFRHPAYLEFEGHQMPVPEDYDKWLTISYGDYMQLPPPEERVYRHDAVFIDLEHSYKQYKGIHYCVDEKKA